MWKAGLDNYVRCRKENVTDDDDELFICTAGRLRNTTGPGAALGSMSAIAVAGGIACDQHDLGLFSIVYIRKPISRLVVTYKDTPNYGTQQ